MAIVNYIEAFGLGVKAWAESEKKDFEVIADTAKSLFSGDLEGAKESMSEYEIPIVEGYKAGKENIEEQVEDGATDVLGTAAAKTKPLYGASQIVFDILANSDEEE